MDEGRQVHSGPVLSVGALRGMDGGDGRDGGDLARAHTWARTQDLEVRGVTAEAQPESKGTVAVDREEVKKLVDEVSEERLAEVYAALRILLGRPYFPPEDEELSEGEQAEILDGEREIAEGKTVPLSEVWPE